MQLAVCGLHLRGQPLNHQVVELGGEFVRACRSSAHYRMYAIKDSLGKTKPGHHPSKLFSASEIPTLICIVHHIILYTG